MKKNIHGRFFRQVVSYAASRGNLRRIKIFVEPSKHSKTFIDGLLNESFPDDRGSFPLVVAARYGYLDIVKYFLDLGADPNVSGTVEFENDEIFNATPLWAASAAGHFDVVKLLVEETNAELDQSTKSESTPLRCACYDGHIDIVRFLLDHGADINKPNRTGHSPLMISAYRNKEEVVQLLIERKADIDAQTLKGNTALHDAAESGNLKIVKMLIDAGAVMKEDAQGVCPLLCAAETGQEEVVEYLASITRNNILKRDAYKLLGCTVIDKKMDMYGGIRLWKKALEIELTFEEWSQIIEWETCSEPKDVYDRMEEVHRVNELSRIEDDMEAVKTQSLVVRERILGESNTVVHYYLRFRGAVYCDLGRMEKCYSLWKHALEMQQRNFSPLHNGTVTTLLSFQETFGIAMNDYVNGMYADRSLKVGTDWVEFVFEKICFELERLLEWGDEPLIDEDGLGVESATEIEEDKKKLCISALQLINIMERISLHNDEYVELDVSRLVETCKKLHIPILHYSLMETGGDQQSPSDYMTLPKVSVLNKLIEVDVDTTSIDSNGNSPIHVLMQSKIIRKSFIRILLDNGALVFACNNQKNVVYDMLSELNTPQITLGKYITLKGLAANVVKRKYEMKNYEQFLPIDLNMFLLKH